MEVGACEEQAQEEAGGLHVKRVFLQAGKGVEEKGEGGEDPEEGGENARRLPFPPLA
jgi:hypothetical protein